MKQTKVLKLTTYAKSVMVTGMLSEIKANNPLSLEVMFINGLSITSSKEPTVYTSWPSNLEIVKPGYDNHVCIRKLCRTKGGKTIGFRTSTITLCKDNTHNSNYVDDLEISECGSRLIFYVGTEPVLRIPASIVISLKVDGHFVTVNTDPTENALCYDIRKRGVVGLYDPDGTNYQSFI
jgi:hypothetical protein